MRWATPCLNAQVQNRTAISSDSYIYFSAPGVMVVETENGYENVKKQ